MKFPRRKQLLFLVLLGVVSLAILEYRRRNGGTIPTRKPRGNQKGCHLPHPDPYDPSILSYLSKPSPLECSGIQYEFTYLSDDEWLHINESAIEESGINVICFYRCFDRVEGDDFLVKFEEWIEINKTVRPGCEFVETYCQKSSFPKTTIYHNNHNQILTKNVKPRAEETSSKKNVILIVLDSVSHSTFIRSLPESLKVLNSLYKSYIFDGMSKVGDNSYPNGIAFLAGKKREEFGDAAGYFDDHPLIWKDFAKIGYQTFYAEDYPEFNLFAYLAKGFNRKPVDHYLRPFWLNVYGSYLHRRSKFLCYGNNAMHNIQFNYLSQFLQKNKDSPKFALSWVTEVSHDYLSNVNVMDNDLANFLKKHYEDLKESFLFILSDHGHRFDPIRQTAIGRIEEAFPFFSMHIPNSLQRKVPSLERVVQQNTKVFTVFWDFYVTMQEIIDLGKTDKWDQLNKLLVSGQQSNSYSRRGQSLLRPVRDRNCKEAEISDDFCMCYPETARNTSDPLISRLANDFISELNRLLAKYKACAPLRLKKIHQAAKIEDELSGSETNYRITAEAAPSSGIFESVMRYNEETNKSAIYGNVNRVNSYGNQSACIQERILRKYCYCISTEQ